MENSANIVQVNANIQVRSTAAADRIMGMRRPPWVISIGYAPPKAVEPFVGNKWGHIRHQWVRISFVMRAVHFVI